MVRLSKNTQNDLVYGTDGETALGEGFGKPLPYAQHLLCDLHMKDNVISKLNELGIRGKASEIKLSKHVRERYWIYKGARSYRLQKPNHIR